jgi:hypothetical protein
MQSNRIIAVAALVLATVLWSIQQGHFGPPPGERVIVVVHESKERTPEMWQLLDGIRNSSELKKHQVIVLDVPDEGVEEGGFATETIALLEGKVPGVVIGIPTGFDSMKLLYAGPLPEDLDRFLELVHQYGG